MDSFGIDRVKAEKAKAICRYHRLQKIATLLRWLEVCAALILLSWSSTRLQTFAAISFHYLREFAVLLSNPLSVFLVGNAIFLIVLATSRYFSAEDSPANSEELASDRPVREEPRPAEEVPAPESHSDKQIVNTDVNVASPDPPVTVPAVTASAVTEEAPETRRYRRTQSESFEREVYEIPERELRRSETAKCTVEELSSEEFRHTVEAFIEKNHLFMREESMAIVVAKSTVNDLKQ